MAFDPNDKKAWRDFAHATGVLLGAALAEFEAEASSEAPSGCVFAFELMAAASDAAFHFPDGAVQAREGGMTANLRSHEGEMRLELQLVGYAALQDGAGHQARLRTRDGAIDQVLAFDQQGSVVCSFAEEASLRQSLSAFTVEILS